MSTALQDIKKDVDAFTLKVRNWKDVLPIFNFEVTVIQRRTTRRWVTEYLDAKKREISKSLKKPEARETGEELAGIATDLLSLYTGRNLRPEGRKLGAPMIVISKDGELSVSRGPSFAGIQMNEEEFQACIDRIKKRVNEDPIDVDASPELIAKGYFVEVYQDEWSKLPTFKASSA